MNPGRRDTYREFDEQPPEREVWCRWLRMHGADPNDVVLPGWIERCEQDYQLKWLALTRDAHGNYVPRRHAGGELVTETRVFQLEGSPLPFPVP